MMEFVIFSAGLVAGVLIGYVPTWIGQVIYRKQLEALGDGKIKRLAAAVSYPEEAEDPDDAKEREKKEQQNYGFW